MVKAIIFDLNGVFIISPKLSERFGRDFGVGLDDFLPALKNIMDITRQPNSEDIYGLWKPYLDKWGVELTENEFLDYWFKAETENTELVELAKGLKKRGFMMIILSNNFRERSMYYKDNFPFLGQLFDGVYYSWQTGFVKPDVRAFQNIIKKHNLKPEEVLYFDDSEESLEAARSLGIKAHLFDQDGLELLRSI